MLRLNWVRQAVQKQISMPRLKSYFQGKTTSYRANAYDDSEIADALISFINTNDLPTDKTPIGRRARRLIEITGESQHEELSVQAFTVYHLNGFADLMWARHIERFADIDPLIVKHQHYGSVHEDDPPSTMFFFWYFFQRDLSPIRHYAKEKTGIDLSLTDNEIAIEIKRIQSENGEFNKKVRDWLLSGENLTNDPKVKLLQILSKETPHPDIFIKSAAATQVAASNWDWLARVCLKILYG